MGGLALLSQARSAAAQSSASFPTATEAAPVKRLPPTSAAVPAPSSAPGPASTPTPAPVPSASPAAAPRAYDPAPALLPYRSGLPVPPGYQLEHRAANGLIFGGLASLIVGYATAIAVGANDDFKNGTGWVAVPVIGPWAAIGARAYHCDNSATDVLEAQKSANQCVRGAFNEVQTIAILSADAVVQATGAVLFLAGLASGEDQLLRMDLGGVRVSPRQMGRAGVGIGFDGRF